MSPIDVHRLFATCRWLPKKNIRGFNLQVSACQLGAAWEHALWLMSRATRDAELQSRRCCPTIRQSTSTTGCNFFSLIYISHVLGLGGMFAVCFCLCPHTIESDWSHLRSWESPYFVLQAHEPRETQFYQHSMHSTCTISAEGCTFDGCRRCHLLRIISSVMTTSVCSPVQLHKPPVLTNVYGP